MSHATFEKKKQAKKLFEAGKLQQKQIAKKVQVSEKTIVEWIKKYGWRNEHDAILYAKANPLTDYLAFLQNEYPETYTDLIRTFTIYKEND